MKFLLFMFFAAVLLVSGVLESRAQGRLSLTAVGRTSKIKLGYGKRSTVVDLEDGLSNGTMPGNPPHRYRVLFTAYKDGFLYLVANVQSHSPISNPMGPCGGDSPQSILWIKADKTLKKRELDSQIYASCSYNYYDSKLRTGRTGLTINYGGREKMELKYDNTQPQLGLVVKKGN